MNIGDKVHVYKGKLDNVVELNNDNTGVIIEITDDVRIDFTGDEYFNQFVDIELENSKLVRINTGDDVSIFPEKKCISVDELKIHQKITIK